MITCIKLHNSSKAAYIRKLDEVITRVMKLHSINIETSRGRSAHRVYVGEKRSYKIAVIYERINYHTINRS
jgi:hypothetical protein